jgi:circadian clock protein KaiB
MSKPANYKFRLYVAGNSSNSAQAKANLQAFCSEHLPERHQIEIVDVLVEPKRALTDGVLLTPTLVKVSPDPIRKIIGTLTQRPSLMAALGLLPEPA